jgi:hypothetical protein
MQTLPMSAEDLRREHDAALASLTPVQRRAIERLARARRMSTFNHRWPAENLQALFQAEVTERDANLRPAA